MMLKKKYAKRLANYLTTVVAGKSLAERNAIAEAVTEMIAVAIKDDHKPFFEHLTRKEPIGATERPRLGDGSGDAAIAIGEHAFYAGFKAGTEYASPHGDALVEGESYVAFREIAWSNYEPSEDIKELS